MLDSKEGAKVLVAVLCFNHGAYVEQCLSSIFMQKCNFKYKVFVYDDVSTDNSWDIILKYKKQYNDNMIIFQPEKNQFSQGKFNTFYKKMTAMREFKYIAMCEADDYWLDCNKLQKQYDSMEKNSSCSMCVCATDSIDDIHQRMMGRAPLNEKDEVIAGEKVIIDALKNSCLFGTNTYFMRNKCFANINMDTKFWNYVAGDMAFILYLATQGDIYYLGECMAVKRRFNKGSISEKKCEIQDSARKALEKNFKTDIEWVSSFNEITDKYSDAVQRYIIWRKIRLYYIQTGKMDLNQYVNTSNGKLYTIKLFRKVNRLYVRFIKFFYENDEVKFVKKERKWMEKEWKRILKKADCNFI